MSERSAEFLAIAEAAGDLAVRESELDTGALDALEDAAEQVGKSWSKSNLGYQANVYYDGFTNPPPGAVFSREWGFEGSTLGSRGDWRPYEAADVVRYIENLAGDPDLTPVSEVADEIRAQVTDLLERARSLAARTSLTDDYLKENIEALGHLSLPDRGQLAQAQMHTTKGQFVIRDMQAAEGGWQAAGHQIALARVFYVKSPYHVARELNGTCRRLAMHLEGADSDSPVAVVQLGRTVFIGHGGASNEYLKLGVWLTDLGLEWEVFDRKPTAGVSTKERLLEMLDNAQIAFLLMTPEDEDAAGKLNARANVIHEVGLFQGRLGWMKAIMLLEDGCEEFSNIDGVGQIRYPKGNISAKFDEIRQVLQREGVL